MRIANQYEELGLNMHRFFPRLLCVLMFLAIQGGLLLVAQSVTARFSGQVTDTDGGAIPGATVQIINQESFAKREVKTDGTGNYIVATLPAGRYQITVEADGFTRRASSSITLVAGQVFVFNVQMAVGGVQTEVQVNAGAGATTVE